MNARQTTIQAAETMATLLTRMQEAASAIARQEEFDWGIAEQMRDALKYTVHAAFAMGVISEAEAGELGFPVRSAPTGRPKRLRASSRGGARGLMIAADHQSQHQLGRVHIATKTTSAKFTSVRKGEVYETRSGQLIEVTNGRLRNEGEQGASFTGRMIEFNLETGQPARSRTTDLFYLDELVKKLTKKDYDEWAETGRREAEALATAENRSMDSQPEPPAAKKNVETRSPRKMSALEAAAMVLAESEEPLTAKGMIEAMGAKGNWTSPGGQTPHATLYAAIIREIHVKGSQSRFRKADRGLFTLNAEGRTVDKDKASKKAHL